MQVRQCAFTDDSHWTVRIFATTDDDDDTDNGAATNATDSRRMQARSCPWVGLTCGLGRVGSGRVELGREFSVCGLFEIFQFLVGWVHYSRSTNNLQGLC